jgi:hypothetical protein
MENVRKTRGYKIIRRNPILVSIPPPSRTSDARKTSPSAANNARTFLVYIKKLKSQVKSKDALY